MPNYTEGGQFQFSTPDQYGVSVTTNLHDRSFNETNNAASVERYRLFLIVILYPSLSLSLSYITKILCLGVKQVVRMRIQLTGR